MDFFGVQYNERISEYSGACVALRKPQVVDDNRGVHWAAIVFPVLVVLLGAAGYFVSAAACSSCEPSWETCSIYFAQTTNAPLLRLLDHRHY